MAKYRIAVLVGSLRKKSFNARLADSLASLAPPDIRLARVQISDLPPYSEDDDGNPAPAVVRLRKEVAAAQGVVFVTPEYNRSLPGVLKNAIDLGSRPYGQSVGAQACGGPRSLPGSARYLHGAATSAQCARLSRHADARPA
ncbi:hypothetical protein GCM10011320_55260 [Neoroseomonas lacus]|uniref:NADPH-dependent FMN reductase-like domain-containing protein n=1 Tax=Neoroseomonas lacus TaxID=287609 RepID=A0A917L1K0_9PROT|nr:hypothetical protein GCM10011320_55260 [Neoroseomonas lacus]